MQPGRGEALRDPDTDLGPEAGIQETYAQLASIPDDEERLVLATGRFIREVFRGARLDSLFLAMPVSWKGTLLQ